MYLYSLEPEVLELVHIPVIHLHTKHFIRLNNGSMLELWYRPDDTYLFQGDIDTLDRVNQSGLTYGYEVQHVPNMGGNLHARQV